MTLEQQVNINLTGIEANTLFYTPVYMENDLKENFRIMPGVTSKKKMGFVGDLEKIVRRYSGCGFNPTGSMQITDRFIEVDKAKFDIEQCWDEMEETIYEEALSRGIELPNITGTIFAEILINRVTQAVKRDNMRLAFFGNKASSSAAYDIVDGLWTVLIPQFVADGSITRVNAGSSLLAAGDGFSLLRQVYDKQSIQLKGIPRNLKKFYVSGDVHDQLIADIENGGGADFGLSTLLSGIQQVTFRGIPVVEMLTWNQITSTDLGLTNHHQVLLTMPSNLVMATDIVGGENQMKIWYNEEDEMFRMKGRWKTGFNIVHPSLISVAY